MALPWNITDNDAQNIYVRMCNYYNSPENLPDKLYSSSVFFHVPNFTKDKLIYCIEYMKKNFSLGWFESSKNIRDEALTKIAESLYSIFGGSVEYSGIVKFLNWVYSFAKNDSTALNYFAGGSYSFASSVKDTAQVKVADKITSAADYVKYGLDVPVVNFDNPILKYGLLFGLIYIIFK